MNNKETCLIIIQFVKVGNKKHNTYVIQCPELDITILNDIDETARSKKGEVGFTELERTNPEGVHRFEIKGTSQTLKVLNAFKIKI